MKTAFPYWHNRIAPVFDTARQILIVELESGMIADKSRVVLPDDDPMGNIVRLVELEIDSLVCGALSRPVFQMITAYGIRVIPFVAGDIDEIVKIWVAGRLQHEVYAMPGCRMRRRRRSRDVVQQDVVPEELNPQVRFEGKSRDEEYGRHRACHVAIKRQKE